MLRRALVLLAVLAGCVSSPPRATDTSTPSTAPATDVPPAPALFLLVEDRYYVNRTSGTGSTSADVGGHCDDADYVLDPPALDLTYRGTAGPPPDYHASVVRHYEAGTPSPATYSVGSGDVFSDVSVDHGTFDVLASFGGHRVLLTLTIAGDEVAVNGTSLAAGSAVQHRFGTQWSERQGDATTTFQADEHLTVLNLGVVQPRVDHQGNCL